MRKHLIIGAFIPGFVAALAACEQIATVDRSQIGCPPGQPCDPEQGGDDAGDAQVLGPSTGSDGGTDPSTKTDAGRDADADADAGSGASCTVSNGGCDQSDYGGGGGGAGGSVYIAHTGTLTGFANITAAGGNGGGVNVPGQAEVGGAGSIGRIFATP